MLPVCTASVSMERFKGFIPAERVRRRLSSAETLLPICAAGSCQCATFQAAAVNIYELLFTLAFVAGSHDSPCWCSS